MGAPVTRDMGNKSPIFEFCVNYEPARDGQTDAVQRV